MTKKSDTATTVLDKLLSETNSQLITTENEIAKIGTRASHGRLESLEATRNRLEKERGVLDWTRQLYDMAHGGKRADEQERKDALWNAIADSKLKISNGIGAEVWKVIDPMLERLQVDFGDLERYSGSSKTFTTNYKEI